MTGDFAVAALSYEQAINVAKEDLRIYKAVYPTDGKLNNSVRLMAAELISGIYAREAHVVFTELKNLYD